MRHRFVVASILSTALLVPALGGLQAAPKNRGGHGGGKNAGTITVSPQDMTMASVTSHPLSVCVSGFGEGNFVSVIVPWVGTSESHSNLTFGNYIDQTGGFCVQCPPSWTTLNLEPGTYTIQTIWYRDGRSDQRNTGPSATFTVNSAE